MLVDLHTHTTASDGKLAPVDLLERARAAGIDLLSITDHDTIAAYAELPPAAAHGLTVIAGVEFSTHWQGRGVHIVGLNVGLDSTALETALTRQGLARQERAVQIAERLRKRGIADALAGATLCAGTGALGRPHFAEYLVGIRAVASIEQAFRKYLDSAHTGSLNQHWASLAEIIEWIRGAGGDAVLAHPAKYRLTRTRLARLAAEFRLLGGAAIEVISGQQSAEVTRDLASLAEVQHLQAALGSDFHQPGQVWSQLGRLPPLPSNCTPVWADW